MKKERMITRTITISHVYVKGINLGTNDAGTVETRKFDILGKLETDKVTPLTLAAMNDYEDFIPAALVSIEYEDSLYAISEKDFVKYGTKVMCKNTPV